MGNFRINPSKIGVCSEKTGKSLRKKNMVLERINSQKNFKRFFCSISDSGLKMKKTGWYIGDWTVV